MNNDPGEYNTVNTKYLAIIFSRAHQINKLEIPTTLRWRHNERDGASNHQPHHCLLKRLFRRRSQKTSEPRVTGLCAGNSPGTGEFPAQMASNAENISIWWRHHEAEARDIFCKVCNDKCDIWNGCGTYTLISTHVVNKLCLVHCPREQVANKNTGFMMTSSNGNIFRVMPLFQWPAMLLR